MGLFGPSIGKEKIIDGERFGYGWCYNCLGDGYGNKIISHVDEKDKPIIKKNPEGKKEKCVFCGGKGKRWYGPIEPGIKLQYLYIDSGFKTVRYYVFDKERLEKTMHYVPMASNSDRRCSSHDWKFDYKGADPNHPRIWYKCIRCGASGVAENMGSPIREQ